MRQSERMKLEAIERLHELLQPGTVVYTVLHHVSKSGMMRRISLKIVQDKDIRDITHYAAVAMGDKVHCEGGIIVHGCGQDMGYALVHNLGYKLWPQGTKEPHGVRNGEPDTCGGYALKHRWL